MNTSNHLTEDDLQILLASDELGFDCFEAEEHLSDCDNCRTRLESLATDGDWLNDFREQLSTHGSYERISTASKVTEGDALPYPRYYEQVALDSMLRELLPPPSHPELLSRLAHYDVEKVIGFGGMGVVAKAWDTELRRPVAIKLLTPQLLHDGTAKQRFAREARAAAAILHPNVIAIHGIDCTNGLPWIVMPLVTGPTLQQLVAKEGPLRDAEIARIGSQIASGLAAAHSHGVVHRDIKPANILVDNRINRVVITDFGLARRDFEHSMTGTGSIAGTLSYMSPEQTRCDGVDGRSDLFGVGALLYFLASGATPFHADSPAGMIHRIVNEPHADVRTLNPEISSSLSDSIDCLLSKSPSDRFQSAAELEDHFSKLIAHLNHPTQHSAPVVPRRCRRTGMGVYFAGAFVLIALTYLFLWGGQIWRPAEQEHPAIPQSTRTSQEIRDDLEQRFGITSATEFGSDLEQFRREVNEVDLRQSAAPLPENDSLLRDLRRLDDAVIDAVENKWHATDRFKRKRVGLLH